MKILPALSAFVPNLSRKNSLFPELWTWALVGGRTGLGSSEWNGISTGFRDEVYLLRNNRRNSVTIFSFADRNHLEENNIYAVFRSVLTLFIRINFSKFHQEIPREIQKVHNPLLLLLLLF